MGKSKLNTAEPKDNTSRALSQRLLETFGENVFDLKAMKRFVSAKTYASIEETIKQRAKLDLSLADEIATAMKDWALSKGATHFTHWFQPLSGITAEKHEAFIAPDGNGNVMVSFSGKDLVQGEPDASSFPSGGLRMTFEARGYTGWDPTSPAFIMQGPATTTLCIPTFYIGYHGEALDKKTPLLRSVDALNKQVMRLAKHFGIKGKRAHCSLGPEQEYFLISKKHYLDRMDLIQTGRTLFGRKPAKHQQQEDQYFGPIKSHILGFMEELDRTMWSLGIPAKTRHNEVAPAQYEIAPIFEEMNISIDHNMLTMEVMRQIADKMGLVCLLHEKPFAGVNGSGKHNNWSIVGPDGKNWLNPGKTPHENALFLTTLCAIIQAIDTHADLLRVSIASAANDHRLGANEAPPAIISIFLGDQLLDIIEQVEKGGSAKSSKDFGEIHIDVDSLPMLVKDPTDRNRTSPFAFTGAKFEFRSVGSHQNCSTPNMMLNTIVAEALSSICDQLDARLAKKEKFPKALQEVLQGIIKKHKRIIFNGNNYSQEWVAEAKKRGLPNLKSTPEALGAWKDKNNIALFEKHKVLTAKEALSRYEVYNHAYTTVSMIEGECALHMARTLLIPAGLEYQATLSDLKSPQQKKLYNTVSTLVDKALTAADNLEKTLGKHNPLKINEQIALLREAVDALEAYTPARLWPLPSYAEMLFLNG
jgi:glutamine synthetase